MIHIQALGLNLFFIFLISACTSNNMECYFSDVKVVSTKNFSDDFNRYCIIDTTQNFELNAVLCSFIGDYESSIKFATRDVIQVQPSDLYFGLDDVQIASVKEKYNIITKSEEASKEVKFEAQRILELLNRHKDLKQAFKNQILTNAKKFIVGIADNYHYILINEAHYSSQNRAFTRELLEPLWNNGYRYLALETLSENEQDLLNRGYPVKDSGYYTRDPVFGNMVRDAIKIGYKLISYDYKSQDNNLRDSIQALNIYNKTFQNDKVGKVLVHAGYSHISEFGDERYEPMGSRLKKILGADILTIDQVNMTERSDPQKLHPYYQYVRTNYAFDSASIIIDKNQKVLVDPINSFGIDLQIYHPVTIFEKGRPTWIVTENYKSYKLPTSMKLYKGHLLQIIGKDELKDAIPLDQFVITKETSVVLPKGEYIFRLIDREGSLKGRGDLKIE
jgi:hypothetical protein